MSFYLLLFIIDLNQTLIKYYSWNNCAPFCAVLSCFRCVWLFATLWTSVLWSSLMISCMDSPGKNTGVDCHVLHRASSWPTGRTLVWKAGVPLLHCKWILYHGATREAQFCSLVFLFQLSYIPFLKIRLLHIIWNTSKRKSSSIYVCSKHAMIFKKYVVLLIKKYKWQKLWDAILTSLQE